ncbi:MAG: DNA glycosylase [Thermoplasmata archaeon]
MDDRCFQDDTSFIKAIKKIQTELLGWGKKNIRNYPWRNTYDPYKIIVAEIMLDRTGADQVKKVYTEFICKFPDFKSIVMSGQDKIKSELSSLGLVRRSSMLYLLALEVVDKYGGVLPANRNELMQLPGIGNYIASAVLCMVYNLPEPVLDTNTVRVIGRIFGIKITDSSRKSKKFQKIIRKLMECKEPRNFFLSIIDFAALVCTAKDPECFTCPVNDICCFKGSVWL